MIHNIRFREFVYESENLDELTQAIYNIFPDAEIESEDAEGLMEDKIIILSGVVDKKRQTKAFFNLLLELDQNQLDKLNNDLERKVDDKGNLFLRLSKEDAVDEKITIVDSGDSIHLKVKIAAYPAKKEIAIKKVREAIENNWLHLYITYFLYNNQSIKVSGYMKDEVFYGKGIHELEGEYPDLYDLVKNISELVYDGHALDYKTQKLIAIGITASRADPRATKKQIKSGMQELDITKEEIMDVLKIVLLTSGMPAFSKAVQILNSVIETQ